MLIDATNDSDPKMVDQNMEPGHAKRVRMTNNEGK
jgi:hypothetical protein